MKKPKIKKKPEPKSESEIVKLLDVLDELEEDTDCRALDDAHGKVESALRSAREVHDELLDLHAIRIDHKTLLKVVSVFLDAVKTVAATGKAK